MKLWQFASFGLEHLQMVERESPALGPGEVKIAMRAFSLNYRDLLVIKGLYNPRFGLPLTPLSDGAGEVVAVGEGVREIRVGEAVVTHFLPYWLDGQPTPEMTRDTLGGPLPGVLSETVVLPHHGVVPLPPGLDFAQGATLPIAALTAWNALVSEGGLCAGQTVLLLGTGGVSLFALQLAKGMGARVIITSSSDEKLARVKSLGADHGINYRSTPDWEKQVLELTQGQGVDLALEVAGAGAIARTIAATRPFGKIALIGILAGASGEMNWIPLLMKHLRLQGIFVGHRRQFLEMNRAIAQLALKPYIDRLFPFAQAPEAFRYLALGKHIGKVVIGAAT